MVQKKITRFLKKKRNIRLSLLDTETDNDMETSSIQVNNEQVNEINTSSNQINSEQVNEIADDPNTSSNQVNNSEQVNEINDMKPLGIAVIEEKKSELQKPFLKWVGGKTQLITKILSKFPREMENLCKAYNSRTICNVW